MSRAAGTGRCSTRTSGSRRGTRDQYTRPRSWVGTQTKHRGTPGSHASSQLQKSSRRTPHLCHANSHAVEERAQCVVVCSRQHLVLQDDVQELRRGKERTGLHTQGAGEARGGAHLQDVLNEGHALHCD